MATTLATHRTVEWPACAIPDGMRSLLFGVAFLIATPAAWGAKFGGFSSDGKHYLDGDARVCAALAAAEGGAVEGAPQCQRVTDKKELAAHAFKKPKPARETADGKIKLATSFE